MAGDAEVVVVSVSSPGSADVVALATASGVAGPGVGLVLQAATGAIVAATPEAEAILGLTLDQLMGRTSQDPRWVAVDAHGSALAGDQHPAMRALATGAAVRGAVLGVHRPDHDAAGAHIWLTVTSVLVDADPGAVLTAFTEIAGARAQELRLAESERMFRFLAESSTDMVAWQLPDTTFLWVSSASVALLGLAPAELVGVRAGDLVHADDVAAARAALTAAVADPTVPFDVTLRLRHADGHPVWLEVSGGVISDAGGRPAQLRTAWRDVSARVRAETERDAAVSLVRATVESSPVGIALRALGGAILQANPALCRMLGRAEAELVGATLMDLTHPDDLPAADQDPDGVEALLAGDVETHVSERRYLRPDGTVMWGQRTAVLLPAERGRPVHLLVQLQDVTERKEAVDALAQTALTDPLTGLVNRSVFMDRLAHSLQERRARESRVGVLFIDLDHFKSVNDTLGHEVGDEVLRQSADRITAAVRHGDLVARLGGDEFVALCTNVDDLDVVRDIADRVVVALAVPFTVGAREVRVSASVGVTLADRSTAARDALSRADAAMYRAKQAGRGRYELVVEALETLAQDELALDEDLRRGIAAGELRLLYQPIVRSRTRTVLAREALVRWQHPTRGLLGPGAFLAAADRSPLTLALGAWVLDRACADAVTWPDESAVHVNISPRHLAEHGFAESVEAALHAHGLAADRLCLEVTETLVLTASRSTLRAVAALTGLGVRIALDDFGTGQSSISALHRLPVSSLKVDMSFVQDLGTPTTAALVDGLIHLGRGMGLDVVAEGVETEEQARWLVEHGCPHHQGYLYGRPDVVAGCAPRVVPTAG